MMANIKGKHYRLTLANMTGTALTLTQRPIRMRCVEMCMRRESCVAVNYKTQPTGVENCVLIDSMPEQNQMVGNEEWNLVILP